MFKWLLPEYRMKRRHFSIKAQTAKLATWDWEFMKHNYRLQREELRRLYDRQAEEKNAYETVLARERQKKEPDKTIIETTEKTLEGKKQDIDQLTKQMDGLDSLVEKEVDPKIVEFASLHHQLKEYVKKL